MQPERSNTAVRTARFQIEDALDALIAQFPTRRMTVVAELIEKLFARDGAAETANVIKSDADLASRLIQVANTVSFGGGIPATRVETATIRLGALRARSLAVVIAVTDLLSSGCRDQMTGFWRDCLARASLSRALAMNASPELAGRAFVVGALQHAGIVLMERRYADSYRTILAQGSDDMMRRAVLEWQRYGFNHIHASMRLLERLNLPSDLCMGVSRQYTNPPRESGLTGNLRLWQIAFLAGGLPMRDARRDPVRESYLKSLIGSAFGLGANDLGALLGQAAAEFDDVRTLFRPLIADASCGDSVMQPTADWLGCEIVLPDLVESTRPSARRSSRVERVRQDREVVSPSTVEHPA